MKRMSPIPPGKWFVLVAVTLFNSLICSAQSDLSEEVIQQELHRGFYPRFAGKHNIDIQNGTPLIRECERFLSDGYLGRAQGDRDLFVTKKGGSIGLFNISFNSFYKSYYIVLQPYIIDVGSIKDKLIDSKQGVAKVVIKPKRKFSKLALLLGAEEASRQGRMWEEGEVRDVTIEFRRWDSGWRIEKVTDSRGYPVKPCDKVEEYAANIETETAYENRRKDRVRAFQNEIERQNAEIEKGKLSQKIGNSLVNDLANSSVHNMKIRSLLAANGFQISVKGEKPTQPNQTFQRHPHETKIDKESIPATEISPFENDPELIGLKNTRDSNLGMVAQSKKAEAALETLANDLTDLAATDSDCEAIVKKYGISRNDK
jgi:hypothetical protein